MGWRLEAGGRSIVLCCLQPPVPSLQPGFGALWIVLRCRCSRAVRIRNLLMTSRAT
jgi:hypothetical protein